MGLRPEIYGVDEKVLFGWFNCKNEAKLKEFIQKLEETFKPPNDRFVDLEEMKELARRIFMESKTTETFESKHSPENDRTIENQKVHIPLAIQLSIFGQEGIVNTDSNFWNGGGYFEEIAAIEEIEPEAENHLLHLCGYCGFFNPDEPQNTSWSYYGYLTHKECIVLREHLQKFWANYKPKKEKNEAGFKPLQKHVEQAVESLIGWLTAIIDGNKMLFIFTQ